MKKMALALTFAIAGLIGLVPVLNSSAAGNNLITNPSVETAAGSGPASWSNAKTGNNTTSFNYLNSGHSGSHSLQVQMTQRSGGQAEWYFTPVTVAANTKYTFTDWYQSNIQSHYDVMVTKSTGATSQLATSTLAASPSWQQGSISFTTPRNAVSLTVFHFLNRVGQLTTDDFDLEGPAPLAPPTVNVTAPLANATVAGTQTVSATASDSTGIKNVQFKLDGTNLGSTDSSAPYNASWNTKNSTNAAHTLSAVVTNTSNVTATAPNIVVTVNNPTVPTVQITSPTANASLSGTQTITANASGAQSISSVQFKLNGTNLGPAISAAPYTYNWDTTTKANGPYSLTAVATNSANLSTTSSAVPVTVANQVVTPPNPGSGPNLIANPSVENSANGTAPDSWLSSNWGTNTSAFNYLNTGHTGNRSVEVQTTGYTDGAANWYYADIPITPAKTYQYVNWYKSNVDTEVDAEVVMNDNSVQYYWLGTVLANTNWTKFTTTFTPPAGAKSLAVYQILAKVGYIISDDYSLNEYTPLPLNRGIISVSFDDGWTNQYTNAYPLLRQYGIPATFNIISGELSDQPDYMTITQIKNLFSAGHEIASHTITHSDLTTVSQAKLVQEMQQSQATLQNAIGAPVTDFAYPYGAYNANTLTVGSQYYQSQRTVNAGYNTKDNFNLTQLKIYEVDSNISQAQVKGWIDGAIAQRAWLILVYHEIATVPVDPTDALYTTQPADLAAELAYIHNSGVAVETVHQAINEILPQL